ncbi:TetR/AcrR family transcriptional regulator [Streptomyces sp. NPDC051940]|uniref:TetR/AcrR family transcriptional regulator n=1 Tax=Streptomyces sp. NPDC051940 TaxID=3155675 RepID=UPI0034354EEC
MPTTPATPDTPKQPPAGPRAEAKRAAIVKAARELFLREGFAVSVDHIAAAAGVSKVTVYNHFGSKEALFVAVIKDSTDAPLGETLTAAVEDLGDSDDLRAALIAAGRAWVAAVHDNPDVLALNRLVAAELPRFPELGAGWRHADPAGHHPAVAEALTRLCDRGRLAIPDLRVAVLQLYSLLYYPHLVFAAYGTSVDADLTERLISGGVDMFLGRYEQA